MFLFFFFNFSAQCFPCWRLAGDNAVQSNLLARMFQATLFHGERVVKWNHNQIGPTAVIGALSRDSSQCSSRCSSRYSPRYSCPLGFACPHHTFSSRDADESLACTRHDRSTNRSERFYSMNLCSLEEKICRKTANLEAICPTCGTVPFQKSSNSELLSVDAPAARLNRTADDQKALLSASLCRMLNRFTTERIVSLG